MSKNHERAHHGHNIRRWRELRNMNQEELAKRIEMSQSSLSSYETKRTIEPETLHKIADALDVPVKAITEMDDESLINIFSGTWNDNSYANGYVQTQIYNPVDKIVQLYDEKIALYERMLQEKENVLLLLQEVLKELKA